MCKIFVSILVLVTIISLSQSKGIIPTDIIADTLETIKPVGAGLGRVVGLLASGPDGVDFGSKGPPKVIQLIADNVRNSKNESTLDQASALFGSAVAFPLATLGGALVSIPQQDIRAGVANAQKGAETGIELGNILKNIL